MTPPRHYNPPPMFGLRVQLDRTSQAILFLIRHARGVPGIESERLAPLLFMTDVIARQYLGHPLTDIEWTREMLLTGPLP